MTHPMLFPVGPTNTHPLQSGGFQGGHVYSAKQVGDSRSNRQPVGRTSYALRLSGGLAWTISAESALEDWLARLSRIMQLPETSPNGNPCFHIVRHGGPEAAEAERQWQAEARSTSVCFENKHTIVRFDPKSNNVLCGLRHVATERHIDVVHMWMALFPIHVSAMMQGGVPLHAAMVERDGRAVLLAAPGDTGKSTCSRRVPPPWRSPCDDACLVVPVGSNGYRVHPLPTWSNFLLADPGALSERGWVDRWDVGASFPLAAICFLQQSEDDWLDPLRAGEAALHIFDSFKQIQGNQMKKYRGGPFPSLWTQAMDNACSLARSVPACSMGISLHGRFWERLDDLLGETGKDGA